MPPRLTAQDFDQELLVLFDAYVHGGLDRRGFLDKAQKFAKAGMTAAGLLATLSPNFAAGQQVRQDDPRLNTDRVNYPSPDGTGSVKGYLARPAGSAGNKLPAILVVHENRGLNPHIEDIARRLALDGFMAFAPDGLTVAGGYPGDEDKAREAFAKLDGAKMLQDFVAAAHWLKARNDGTGKLGVVGFCYGGGVAHQLAIRLPTWPHRCLFTATYRRLLTPAKSRRRCWCIWPASTSGSTPHGPPTKRHSKAPG